MGFPKGKIEKHLGTKKSALTEAWEEAGLRGKIKGESLGSFKYIKVKTGRAQLVTMFPMKVTKEDKNYMEQTGRKKVWLPYKKAVKLVKAVQRSMLEKAHERVSYKGGS